MAESNDLTRRAAENSSSTASDGREIADFECNICFDLAQDPVITICGHLHCWPCLYKWLRQFHECPVCKAVIEEEKLIPLYGRGKTTSDPRLFPRQGVEIPHRPAGQRPETAPSPPPLPEANNVSDAVFRRIGGFIPVAPPAAFSHFGVSAGFGGVLSPIFSVRFHEFSDETGYGGSSGFHYGYPGSFGEGGLNRESNIVAQGNHENLKKIMFFILLFVLFALLF